ncbi:MAG TPA: phosphotransferase family protein [Marmoricola sp.]|nr:phosphotransferase family protein [Marmoricola sp.]
MTAHPDAADTTEIPASELALVAELLREQGVEQASPLRSLRIGDGRSNLTYLVSDGVRELVLRRPPLPPFDPSAHDVLREAWIVSSLAGTGVPVPTVLLACEDVTILGAPFYVMDRVRGDVVTVQTPAHLASPEERRRMALGLVDGLAALHQVDWRAAGLGRLERRGGYLERQLARFRHILENGGHRRLPAVDAVGTWLHDNLPDPAPARLVHGDYRIGNVIWAPQAPARLAAVLDWELASVGDPLADVAFLLATYPVPGDSEGALLSMAPATLEPGFPGRAELAARYEEATGEALVDLQWYTAYVFWRGAVGLESFYQRMLAGTIPAEPFYASLESEVPELARRAAAVVDAGPGIVF